MSTAPSRRARVLAPEPAAVREAAELIRAGRVVAMPTETVYGLAADAFNPNAVLEVFASKERPKFDPLIVHVRDIGPSVGEGGSWLDYLDELGLIVGGELSGPMRDRLERLMRRFWPGPLTVVLPRGGGVPDLVTSGLSTVAVRVPAHPVAQALLETCGTPLAAPSANRFGRISPTRSEHVLEELGDRIPLILDGGPSEVGVESTVIRPSARATGSWFLLRPGGIPTEEIEAVVGARLRRTGPGGEPSGGAGEGARPAPGLLASHYAPTKPLVLLEPGGISDIAARTVKNALSSLVEGAKVGGLTTDEPSERLERELAEIGDLGDGAVLTRSLSPHGDAPEAARNLFGTLRELDRSEAQLLVARLPSTDTGLWSAIADRLRRASHAD